MKTSLSFFTLRSLAVLAAATALMSAANASTARHPLASLPRTAPIMGGAGTTVFNPGAASSEVPGAST